VRELDLENRIQFMNAQPQAELASRMAQASVLVLPSASEGLGRVIVEAMATGTPTIGSRVGGIPDLIKDGLNGFLIPPGDEQALANRIRWILTNPIEARMMGQRGRAFAAGVFSTESYLEGYKKIFDLAQMNGELKEHAAFTL
jgi:glycosyltransferase involved in cell wall biosynthesis